MAEVPFDDCARQFAALWPELGPAIERAFRDEEPILGRAVGVFEEQFADYVGLRHAIGLGSGADALTLGLRARGVGRGDRVLVAANAPLESLAAIAAIGARPTLTDVDDESMLIDPAAIEVAIGARTRAVLLVHLHGRTCAIEPIEPIARAHGLAIVEDAGQAHGACAPDGRRAGALGDLGAFGFHPRGSLGAFGDAGAITTDDAAVAERVLALRSVGRQPRQGVAALVPGSRLDTLQAVVLSVRLRQLDRSHACRTAIAARYLAELEDIEELRLPDPGPGLHAWRRFVVRTSLRDALAAHLRQNGVRTGVSQPVLPHLRALEPSLAQPRGAFPVAERIAEENLSLPISPDLSEAEVFRVCVETRRFFA